MGQILSSPITTKNSSDGKDERLSFGASSMQGWRITMEDAHTHILNYKDTDTSFFAVFDGHGGQNVAKYSSEKLAGLVIESKHFKNGEYKEALRKAFFQIDIDLQNDLEYKNETSGCTAIVALITKDNTLYVSNAGDSRAIICTNSIGIALSKDHKPTDPKETERIHNAGGHVEFGRVNGNLALSRALGDFEFKKADLPPEKQAVTADPDITVHKITDKDEFMVLACDGIWDCMSNQEVATFIRKEVINGVPLKVICEKLMDYCLSDNTSSNAGIGCDNMTVEIIAFLNGKSEEEWYNSIRGESTTTKQESSKESPERSVPSELTSESRQHTKEELQQAPDLTSSLLSSTNKENKQKTYNNIT